MQVGSYRPMGIVRTVLLLLVAIGVYSVLGRWWRLGRVLVGSYAYERFGWYLALLAGTLLIGWFARRRSWLLGLIGGLCMQGPGILVESIRVVRVSRELSGYPFTVAGPPAPMPDLIATFSPLLIAAAVGAIGGFCGQREVEVGRGDGKGRCDQHGGRKEP